jgi:hypothetical protein
MIHREDLPKSGYKKNMKINFLISFGMPRIKQQVDSVNFFPVMVSESARDHSFTPRPSPHPPKPAF